MTWSNGFRLKSGAFLIADSAVTSNHPLQHAHSTFGESQVSDSTSGLSVQEGPLKIYRIQDILITFSGDIATGERFVDAISNVYIVTHDAARSIKQASFEVLESQSICHIEALVAFYDTEPQLIVCKTGREPTALPLDAGYGIGSGDRAFGDYAEGIVDVLPTNHSVHNNPAWIARALSIWQSFGTTLNLMGQNCGGAFCGAWVDMNGAHFQPDILFILYDNELFKQGGNEPDFVATLFRNEVFVRVSSCTQIIGSSHNLDRQHSAEYSRQLEQSAWYEALAVSKSGRFDFVTFLNYERHIVAVVEMRKELEHDFLQIILAPDGSSVSQFKCDPELIRGLTHMPNDEAGHSVPAHHIWLPYRSISETTE